MASFAGRWTETRYLRAFVCIYNKQYKVVQCNFILKTILCGFTSKLIFSGLIQTMQLVEKQYN